MLGFVFGLYPAGRSIVDGALLGVSIAQHSANGELDGVLGWPWFFSIRLVWTIASLLSVAIGFHMVRYIAQRNQGTWFKNHILRGLRTWATAILPALLVAMLLEAIIFVAIVITSGDPVVR